MRIVSNIGDLWCRVCLGEVWQLLRELFLFPLGLVSCCFKLSPPTKNIQRSHLNLKCELGNSQHVYHPPNPLSVTPNTITNKGIHSELHHTCCLKPDSDCSDLSPSKVLWWQVFWCFCLKMLLSLLSLRDSVKKLKDIWKAFLGNTAVQLCSLPTLHNDITVFVWWLTDLEAAKILSDNHSCFIKYQTIITQTNSTFSSTWLNGFGGCEQCCFVSIVFMVFCLYRIVWEETSREKSDTQYMSRGRNLRLVITSLKLLVVS